MRNCSHVALRRSCLLILVTATISCSRLPSLRQTLSENHIPQTPAIVSDGMVLNGEDSEEIIESLGDGNGVTEMLRRQTTLVESISNKPLLAGNDVQIYHTPMDALNAMLAAIEAAEDHVHLETFIFGGDHIGKAFADALIRKRRQGVQVSVIYDSFGSFKTPGQFFKRMEDAGVQVVQFNPVNPLKAKTQWSLNHRDHRKILVIDGKIAFTGGINIYEVYDPNSAGNSKRHGGVKLPMHDLHVKIEGPSAVKFQNLFVDTWYRQKGPTLANRNLYPPLTKKGEDLVRVVGSRPGTKNRMIYLMYLGALHNALKYAHFMSPYFVPSDEMEEALEDAAERGVDVRIVVPDDVDSDTAFHAGRWSYEDLMESGVKIYEHTGGMLHAKAAVVDGVWSSVGSTNLDLRSFIHNDEVNIVVLGEKFGRELESAFKREMLEAREIDPQKWKNNKSRKRIKEGYGRLLRHWL